MKTSLLTTLLLAAFTSFTPRCHSQPQLDFVNGGFETFPAAGSGAPTTFTNWTGDLSTIRLVPEAGLSPRTGSGMLHFLASRTGSAGSQTTCELYQLVSLDPLRALLDGGWTVTVTQTCYFNRVAGDAQTDTAFGSRLDAHDGSPVTFPSRIVSGWLASASTGPYADADPTTWEEAAFHLTIPPAATYLAVKITVGEDIFNDTVFPEFDGHFADDVSLTVGIDPPLPRLDLQLGLDGALLLSWPTFPGFIYQLLRSPSLDSPDWQPFGDPWFGDSFPALMFDTPAAGPAQAYYRLRVTGPGQ